MAWIVFTHPLRIHEHIHLEDYDIVDRHIFIAVQYLESLAHGNSIDDRPREDETWLYKSLMGKKQNSKDVSSMTMK